MKNLLLTLFISATGLGANAQNLICVQSGSNASFYEGIQEAIDASSNGDIIYLPGGSFSENLIVDKGIHLIGVGHYADSSQATGITFLDGDIVVVSGADNGSIQGVSIFGDLVFGTSSLDQVVNDYSLIRIRVHQDLRLGVSTPTTSSHLVLKESVIEGNLWGRNYENVLVKNCILTGVLVDVLGSTFYNNVFTIGSGTYTIQPAIECLFENNVFLMPITATLCNPLSANNTFRNNLFEMENLSSCTNSQDINNIFNIDVQDMFIDASSGVYDPLYDYHLDPTCPGVGAGSDGTNLGIYGGGVGYKEGAVPYNPHVQINQIDNQTNGQGNLPVNIQVSAQDR